MSAAGEAPRPGEWWYCATCNSCGKNIPINRDPHNGQKPCTFDPNSPGRLKLTCPHCGHADAYPVTEVEMGQAVQIAQQENASAERAITKGPKGHAEFRSGPYAKDQGAYDQLIKVMLPVIDPGDVLELHHYFVGYGEIQAAKVLCWPSGELFDAKRSRVEHSLGFKQEGTASRPYWGSLTTTPAEGFHGIVIGLAGIGVGPQTGTPGTAFVDENWPHPSGQFVPRLWTEVLLGGNPPVRYLLKTRKDIKPGRYFVEFNFTYHDGKVWKSTSKKAEFHVRNILERYAVQLGIAWIALIAALTAIAKAVGLIDWIIGKLVIL